MARTEIEHTVVPSLFDRLTDEAVGVSLDPQLSRSESERAFRRSVERDVETLLNTRRTMYPATESLRELAHSVYDFGLVDMTGVPVGTQAGRDRLITALQDAISRFEPRMAEPKVRLVDDDQLKNPQMHFLIEATLLMDRAREQVVFDTVLEVASGEYDVHDSAASAAGA
ncbi:MAG: type VI secretion system baseplate subunit TssE [Gemmatimonadaceae bacterium]